MWKPVNKAQNRVRETHRPFFHLFAELTHAAVLFTICSRSEPGAIDQFN